LLRIFSVIRPDFEVVKKGRILHFVSGYKNIYYFYDVLKSPLEDHLQPILAFKPPLNSPRIDQNQSGEAWWFIS